MGRNNKTFSELDMIRFWFKNLNTQEQADVLAVFLYGAAVSNSVGKVLLLLVDIIFDTLPIPGRSIIRRVILRIFGVVDKVDEFRVQQRAEKVLTRIHITTRRLAVEVTRVLNKV